jgi:hypothetical protein
MRLYKAFAQVAVALLEVEIADGAGCAVNALRLACQARVPFDSSMPSFALSLHPGRHRFLDGGGVRLVHKCISRLNELPVETYTQKLEGAQGDQVFKYLLLINTAAIDGYVAQTRLQAEQSFRLSRYVAVAGFLLIAVGVGVGIYFELNDGGSLSAAYIASVSGIVTEFVSGVFFYMYHRTLQQLNRFHDRLLTSQRVAMSFLATAMVEDSEKRDGQRMQLAAALIAGDRDESEAASST